MRISDWSSDVCSSDLNAPSLRAIRSAKDISWLNLIYSRKAASDAQSHSCLNWEKAITVGRRSRACLYGPDARLRQSANIERPRKIGRAQCRERGCQYMSI